MSWSYTESIKPVSYTHLGNIMDEYDEEEKHIRETGNTDEYIIEGVTKLKELEERFGISFEAVSYTHLDVYKRQNCTLD